MKKRLKKAYQKFGNLDFYSYVSFVMRETLNPDNMNITLETLMNETTGMNPVQFEAYCEKNNILVEWLEVCITDFNDGVYNVALSDYDDVSVFAVDGSTILFQ